ncbi:hypothetical protein [Gemmiger sp.]|uniref:hypothetical protein n=1 Tax=Gemmiger sp. TaxID=2049027 RepID=UPI003F08D9E9
MKQTWVTPRVNIQNFEANEYVAACWGVACKVGSGDYGGYTWSPYWQGLEPLGRDKDDHTGPCSHSENNQFRVNDSSTEVTDFWEINADQKTNLNGGVTYYIDNDNSGNINGGDIIFWYTDGSKDQNNPYGRRWLHYGTVVNADPKHPNRS